MSTAPNVVYVQYTNAAAYPPLHHSAEIFANAGWNVLVLGIDQPGISRLQFAQHRRIEVRLLRAAKPGWRQKLHYVWFCGWAILRARQRRPAWIYASDVLSGPVGLIGTYLAGLRVLYHEHDTPNGAERTRTMAVLLRIRQRLIRRADMVVVPNEQRGRFVVTEAAGVPVPLISVWNCPSKTEVAPAARSCEGTEDFWIVYHGSIVPQRLPTSVIAALGLLPSSVKLRVMGYETAGHQGYVEELMSLATRLGISNRIDVRLVVPTRAEMLDLVRRSSVGLSLMPATSDDLNECTMAGASNKAFEYLAQGIPLVVSDLQDWRTMFVDAGLARACTANDSQSIADAIGWFVAHPDASRQMGEHGRQLALTSWNYEHQFKPVLDAMTHQ